MKDIQSREDIALFVNSFYQKIQVDVLLAPIFTEKIEPEAWPKHLETMTNFWASILLSEKNYNGNPFRHHISLKIDSTYFDRWIQLFEKTINEHFEGALAEETKLRANSIRHIFETKLNHIKHRN